ncbi:YdaS family helix-turn-helix protein [Curvibacter sp. HBC28]|uniref:YdaS family helix-turn-helix protein n=1 Tax=Curvibacter microcysteis TaxID=3026419 RepID=A0ABT5MLC7_9BURK|nr:YdaS family helix-turn-helix protein [Curvibacter sp. HBC28]MDD0817191.1 YdaS family helix-turn-helix protein [Curvibacter sp. HBC28]
MEHPIDRAAKVVGSLAELARCLGVTRGAVNHWKLPGRTTPPEHCPKIERMTGVRCEELNPDIDWTVLRNNLPERTRRTQAQDVQA